VCVVGRAAPRRLANDAISNADNALIIARFFFSHPTATPLSDAILDALSARK